MRQSATIRGTVFGGGSIQLARIFGIRVGVEPSWFIVLFLIIWWQSDYYADLFPGEETKSFTLAAASALLFFLSLLLHELGHAVVARRNGIGILGIDLWMFGGVAKLDRDSDSPGVEFRVAAAGPLVTLLIAIGCFAAGMLVSGAGDAGDAAVFEGVAGKTDELLSVLGWLAFINTALLVFNLIPAFPLDGGRIARSVAWKATGDRNRATRLAARVGRGFSMLMIGGGLALALMGEVFSGIWFAVLGWILGSQARAAEMQTAVISRIEGLSVADVMDSEPVAVPGRLSLDRTWDEFFLRYGAPWFPVVDESGHLTGLITRETVQGVDEDAREGRTAASVMATDSAESSGLRAGLEEPLEELLGREGLQRLGAIMAVDGDGRLAGIVTADQIRRALRGAAPAGP